MTIEVWPHYVLIEGHRIDRPSRLSPSQWMDMWHTAERAAYRQFNQRW